MALHLSGVVLCRPWKPPRLKWEGPFAGPTQRLPQAPEVAERAVARKRWRERQRTQSTRLAAERVDAAGGDIAA